MPSNYPLIDADAHVNPPADFWQDYLPQKYRADAPRIESGDDIDYIVFEGNRKPLGILSAMAGHKSKNYKLTGRKSDTRAGGWEPSARLTDMDKDGIETAVLYGGGPLASKNVDLHVASYEAYDRWLADFCAASPKRLVGIAYLPMFDVEFSIKLMRQMAKAGLRGVLIPAFPQSVNTTAGAGDSGQMLAITGDPLGPRRYSDPEFDAFWSAAVELDMPVHMHLGARASRVDPKYFLSDMVMSKLTMAEPVAVLVFGGVFMRHPKLKFVSVESGVGWFAFTANYMDKIWKKHRHWTKNELKKPPSFYMDRQVYGTFLEDPAGLATADLPGGRNVMWSTDYPHSETSWPNSRETIKRIFKGVKAEDKYRMVCGTAKALYRVR
jgi:predicted TIM-barrel fold metal-dependent hydrolase